MNGVCLVTTCPLPISIQIYLLLLVLSEDLPALLANTPLITYQDSLLTCHARLPLSLTAATFCFLLLMETADSSHTSSSLTHSSLPSLSVSPPPLCLFPSSCFLKSPRGIESLTDCPLLHLKVGWLSFFFTFLQLSSSSYIEKS